MIRPVGASQSVARSLPRARDHRLIGQQDYDVLAGKATERPAWSAEDVAAMHAFMGPWNEDLVASGEFVDARDLVAPVHARRIQLQNGVPVVTDGPYPETQEVLAGYTIVECESFDRATEIAARLAKTPARRVRPRTTTGTWTCALSPIPRPSWTSDRFHACDRACCAGCRRRSSAR
jgi:hypothetical protein